MSKKSHKPYITKEEALAKLQYYCSYQDRCHEEVRSKLIELGVYGHDLEDVMTDLIQEKYLDEERYARSYVRGKFRMKRWGKNKILQNLKLRKISAYCIRKGMTEIDDEEYYQVLKNTLSKYRASKKFVNQWDLRSKLYKHATSKGFESNLINMALEDLNFKV